MLLNLFLMSDMTKFRLLQIGGILLGIVFVIMLFYYLFQAKK